MKIIQKKTLLGERVGRYVQKQTISWFAWQFYPRIYTRLVRAPYSGEELRQLRAERGVGTPPWKLLQRAAKLQSTRLGHEPN